MVIEIWFLILLILCLMFGTSNVFSTIASLIGYGLLALFALAFLLHLRLN